MDQEALESLSPEEQSMLDADAGSPDTGSQQTTSAPGQPPAQGADQGGQPPADGTPGQQKTVPHAALHAEREEHKKTSAQLKDREAQLAVLERRTNLILERLMQTQQQPQGQPQPQAPAEEPIPDLNTDAVGFIVGTLKKQSAELEAIKKGEQTRQVQGQQMTADQQIMGRAAALENQFVAETPDYWEASNFMKQSRHAEYTRMGVSDPMQREAMIAQDARNIAILALQQGRNPAQVVYEMAGDRGYKKAAAPAPAAAAPAADATQQLQRIAEGQTQNQSLTQVRGTAPKGMTAARLYELSEAEFAKALEDPRNLALLGE